MPSFRCTICLDTIDSSAKPMATLCGHIYCLDCATFQFTQTNASCAVCRASQTLERMIRLYPDWEGEETRQNAKDARREDFVSSSPISVRSIDRTAEDTVSSLKYAIADRKSRRDALLACNTFVNSVPERTAPHINSNLLGEISFQLNLLTTKTQDESRRLDRIRQNAHSGANFQVEQHRNTIARLEKRNVGLTSDCETLIREINVVRQQHAAMREDEARQCVHINMLEHELQETKQEKEQWMQKTTKVTKKYYALKNKVGETKRAASASRRGRAHDAVDDLVVIPG